MWTCPVCNQKFRNRNQSHSCGLGSVEQFLEGKSEISVRLYKYFIASYKKIGKFEFHPAKTRIALASRIRFAAINRLGKDFLEGHLVISKDFPGSKCFHRIDHFGSSYVHNFRLYKKEGVTDELIGFMKMAFDEGCDKN